MTKRPWISLEQYQFLKTLKRRLTSGNKECKCGRRISSNKSSCLACAREEALAQLTAEAQVEGMGYEEKVA